MYHFRLILANCSDYDLRDTLYLARLEKIEAVPQHKKHIEILYSTDNHWICSYYNTKKIYIYDSLNRFSLNNDQIIFLQHLYPYFNIDSKSTVFMRVQNQCNGTDCGVFAIAFAVSLLYNQKPECIVYDQNLMRSHLLKIFQTNMISHFPTINHSSILDLQLLEEINERNHRIYNQCIKSQKALTKKCPSESAQGCENNDTTLNQKQSLIEQSKGETNDQPSLHDPSLDLSTILTKATIGNKDEVYVNNSILTQDALPNDKNRSNQGIKCTVDTKILRQKVLRAKKIVAKYCLANSRKHHIKIKSSEYYAKKSASVIDGKNSVEKYLEAQRIIKWTMCQKKIYVKTLTNTLNILKNKAELHLSHLPVDSALTLDNYKIICGRFLHCSSTEPYYYDTSYPFEMITNQTISVN